MSQLAQLPVSERLQLVQDLWDSISDSQQQLPVQEWHRELVNARLTSFDGREEFVSKLAFVHGATDPAKWRERNL